MEPKGTDIIFEEDETAEAVTWKVADGSYISGDSVIFEYYSDGVKRRFKTSLVGVIHIPSEIRKLKVLRKDTFIGRVSECPHAIVMKDMCAACGKDLREKNGMAGQRKEASSANISMVHHVPELIVSNELAKELGSQDQKALLEARKLVLLVDLDQTLVHTTNHRFNMEGSVDVIRYELRGATFYTKVRPYARELIEKIARYYEMHIMSYGERQYAHYIARILDPKQIYFGHRIMSRDELYSVMYKTRNMQSLFPCGDHLIAMIDDRPDVWQYSEALIQVKPYRFFKETGDINALCVGRNAEKSNVDRIAEAELDTDEDETLEHIEKILVQIHSAFYKNYDTGGVDRVQDLKVVISYLRRKVLRGCSVVLSGIVPVGVDPEKTDAFRLCIQFGAKVTQDITKDTTHVIAARWGTTWNAKAFKTCFSYSLFEKILLAS
ncbi:hypothetical protein AB6A40_009215 [Gnathostoma spinigerum]|uniref:RNA polymerase II subunit A C-terminal domain phosphatase n=1 Tax=Gnathostoma spinigerum TaxID=75299 RepID=A0ABD6ERM4_9BILA